MAIATADRSSNKPEQIQMAAEAIGRSLIKRKVFKQIYTGKRAVKTVVELMDATNLSRIRVLDAARALATDAIVETSKAEGMTAYRKIALFQRNRDQVLRLAANPVARKKLVTKRTPPTPRAQRQLAVNIRVPRAAVPAQSITIDDIDSFKAAFNIGPQPYTKTPEAQFKAGMARVLGEHGTFNDWGGELRDLYSSRLLIDGKRRRVAFAFKGPGTTGKLTPAKMGQNGDQILRLLKCPADVFVVQYWGEVADETGELLQKLTELRSFFEGNELLYCVIDGNDSARLIKAYPTQFATRTRRRH
jgi:hypothetical protein